MRTHRYLTFTLVLLFCATQALAQDRGYLDPGDLATGSEADQDIRYTMGKESLFDPGQDTRGSATPVLTGKNTPAATVNTNPAQPKARLASPSSRWHLDLRDDIDRSIELNMSQSGDVVFGTGSIAIGDVINGVAATGTFSGEKLSLDVLSTDDPVLYRFDLTLHGRSFSGDYHAFSSRLVPWTGIAMGSIQA